MGQSADRYSGGETLRYFLRSKSVSNDMYFVVWHSVMALASGDCGGRERHFAIRFSPSQILFQISRKSHLLVLSKLLSQIPFILRKSHFANFSSQFANSFPNFAQILRDYLQNHISQISFEPFANRNSQTQFRGSHKSFVSMLQIGLHKSHFANLERDLRNSEWDLGNVI